MTDRPLIALEEADLGYGRDAVLRNVSLRVEAGESIGLVGPNGAGKTTLLRALLGLLRPLKGRVLRDETKRTAYVPQVEEHNTLWPLTLREAVLLAARAKRTFGRLTPEDIARAESAMEKTGIAGIADQLLRDASGGQRQRTLLAQALSQNPDVLVLDEPTRGLDVVAERDLLALIENLRTKNLTLLLVSHSLQLPLNLTDRIVLFKNGAVISTTSEEIMKTKKLEEIYGVPFLHEERDGLKWVTPLGGNA